MAFPVVCRSVGVALLVVGSFGGSATQAQPKPVTEPSSTHIFPAGARRGTTVDVLVGTECMPPGTEFLLSGDGITGSRRLKQEVFAAGDSSLPRKPTEKPITYPRQWHAQITVAV